MQLLLLAWAFSSFLQGVAGFGVPIAVVAPLLIGLGFAPVVAVAAVAIGHSWSVTFGDIASSFQALMAATGLPGEDAGPLVGGLSGRGLLWLRHRRGLDLSGLALGAPGLAGPAADGRGRWPRVQAGLAVSGLWNLAGFGAGLAGLAAGALVARLPALPTLPAPQSTNLERGMRTERPAMPLGLALAPYLLLIVVVAAAELWPWLHEDAEPRQDPGPLSRGADQLRLDHAGRHWAHHQRLWPRRRAAGLRLAGRLSLSTGAPATTRPASSRRIVQPDGQERRALVHRHRHHGRHGRGHGQQRHDLRPGRGPQPGGGTALSAGRALYRAAGRLYDRQQHQLERGLCPPATAGGATAGHQRARSSWPRRRRAARWARCWPRPR